MGGAGGAVLTLKLQDLFLFSLLFPTVFHPVWFFSSLFVFKRQYNSRFFRQAKENNVTPRARHFFHFIFGCARSLLLQRIFSSCGEQRLLSS